MLLNTLKFCFLLQHLTILTALQLNVEHWKREAGFTDVDEVMFHTMLFQFWTEIIYGFP